MSSRGHGQKLRTFFLRELLRHNCLESRDQPPPNQVKEMQDGYRACVNNIPADTQQPVEVKVQVSTHIPPMLIEVAPHTTFGYCSNLEKDLSQYTEDNFVVWKPRYWPEMIHDLVQDGDPLGKMCAKLLFGSLLKIKAAELVNSGEPADSIHDNAMFAVVFQIDEALTKVLEPINEAFFKLWDKMVDSPVRNDWDMCFQALKLADVVICELEDMVEQQSEAHTQVKARFRHELDAIRSDMHRQLFEA